MILALRASASAKSRKLPSKNCVARSRSSNPFRPRPDPSLNTKAQGKVNRQPPNNNTSLAPFVSSKSFELKPKHAAFEPTRHKISLEFQLRRIGDFCKPIDFFAVAGIVKN